MLNEGVKPFMLRWLVVVGLACLVAGPGATPPVRAGALSSSPTGLLAWWGADGTAQDRTGRHNGSLPGGVILTAGVYGQAFHFNGVDGRVLIADSDDLKLARSLTLSAWIDVEALPGPGPALGQIVFRGDDRGALDPYYLAIVSTGNLRFHVESQADFVDLEAPVPIQRYVHVAATLDGDTGMMRLYEDGVQLVETTTDVRPFRDLDPTQHPGLSLGDLQGRLDQINEALRGSVDEVQIYGRALEPVELQALTAAGRLHRRAMAVQIDVLPGQSTNQIALGSSRPVPVAVLSTPFFDAPKQLNLKSVTFGRTGFEHSLTAVRPRDVNADGLRDAVLNANPRKARFQPTSRQAVLMGQSRDGTAIVGTDSIQVVVP